MEWNELRRGGTQRRMLQEILHADTPLGVDHLSRSLEISRNATYQHLTALERDGLIEKAELSPTGGRPGQTYRLTEAGKDTFPKQYALIAGLLVSVMKSRFGSDVVKEFLMEIGTSLAKNYRTRVDDEPPETRMRAVAEIMRELGYESEYVENGTDGTPEIRAHNCVFHDLAKQHEEVCSLDLAILDELLGGPTDHIECVVRGGTCCRFRTSTPTEPQENN